MAAEIVLLGVVVGCIYGMLSPLVNKQTLDPQWLTVYLTAIYATLTLYMAVGTVVAARAAVDSVGLMQRSLAEQALVRQLEYSALVTFNSGHFVYYLDEKTYMLDLLNLKGKPIQNLCAFLWLTEKDSDGTPTLMYSSMMNSVVENIAPSTTKIELRLHQSRETEVEKALFAQSLLEQFKSRHEGNMPSHSLCVITYMNLADGVPVFEFYDLAISREREFVVV